MRITPTQTRRFSTARLCEFRKLRYSTQTAAADAARIPLDTYRQYENGKAQPSVNRLVTLAGVLGVAMDDLFQEER